MGITPFSGYAKGIGWSGGLGMEIIKSYGFFSGMQFSIAGDNVKFKSASRAVDATAFLFQFFLGYKFPN